MDSLRAETTGFVNGRPCGLERERSYDDQVHRARGSSRAEWPQPPALCFADDLPALLFTR